MVVVSRKLCRTYRAKRVLNQGPVVCEFVTLSARPQLLLCVDRFAPEAIHSPIAIKLLVSGLLTRRLCYVRLFFTSWHVLYLYFGGFRTSYDILTSIDRCGCHARVNVCLLYPEHLVPLPI